MKTRDTYKYQIFNFTRREIVYTNDKFKYFREKKDGERIKVNENSGFYNNNFEDNYYNYKEIYK